MMDKRKRQMRGPVSNRICSGTTETERWVRENDTCRNNRSRFHYISYRLGPLINAKMNIRVQCRNDLKWSEWSEVKWSEVKIVSLLNSIFNFSFCLNCCSCLYCLCICCRGVLFVVFYVLFECVLNSCNVCHLSVVFYCVTTVTGLNPNCS
jgi:hypothetical protein